MQSFGALALALAVAATGPAVPHPHSAAAVDAAEVYVAELDADWNVSREVRVPCDIDRGCSVELALSSTDAGRLQVRFDGVRAGKVAVERTIEDGAGHAQAQPALSLALDHQGFGATHVVDDTSRDHAGSAGVIVMAVKVPGFVAPMVKAEPGTAQPI